jgi:hypothetical protein
MLFILLLVITTWFITNIILSVTESIILRFKPNAGVYAKVYSIVITSIIILIFYFNFSVILDIDNSSVFNMSQDQPSSSKPNPFGVKLVSNTLGSTPEIDIRNISDVLLITAIGKLSIQAMGTVSTPKSKALVGVSTGLSLGTIGAGYKFMNQARHSLRKANDTSQDIPVEDNRPSSPNNDNFTANSTLEHLSSSESLIWVLFCIKLLIVLVLVLIILVIIINWSLNKVHLLNKESYPHYFKFLSKDNNDLFLKKVLSASAKGGKFTVGSLTLLIFINLCASISLINKEIAFISLLDF